MILDLAGASLTLADHLPGAPLLHDQLYQSRLYCSMRSSREDEPRPEDFLPLHRDTFHILVSLADRDRHGYSILLDVAERTSGALRLSPSSLYASIKRLLHQGLIEELTERPDPDEDDERRRYYRLTRLGRKVAEVEARRLEQLLADARATGLLGRHA